MLSSPGCERPNPSERLERLFDAYYGDVLRYTWRRVPQECVEDVVAETFVVAWRRLDSVPPDALPWLLGVTRRVISTRRRADRRRASLVEKLRSQRDVAPEVTGNDDTAVIGALARLPEKDREALVLVAWEGLTPAQAAAVLGISRTSFRARLSRAKRRVRKQLLEGDACSVAPRLRAS